MESIEVPITADNLPKGLHWEADGSCWKAVHCNPATMGCDWRWQPMNGNALGKDRPEGVMNDHFPVRLPDCLSTPDSSKP